jgi:hypothetical protein
LLLTVDIGMEFNLFLRFPWIAIWWINIFMWREVLKLVKLMSLFRFYLLGCGEAG